MSAATPAIRRGLAEKARRMIWDTEVFLTAHLRRALPARPATLVPPRHTPRRLPPAA
jgi:hypothetical protein